MTDTLYLAPIPDDSPLDHDPAFKLSQAQLIQNGGAMQVSHHPPIEVTCYPAEDVMDVSHGDLDSLVMCADDNGLAQRLVSEIKSRRVLLYFKTGTQTDYAHTYSGIFRFSQMHRLHWYPTSDWQIVFYQSFKSAAVKQDADCRE